MSEFICKKPISLSGHNFTAGEVIPDGFVLPNRENALIRNGYIVEMKSDSDNGQNTPISEDFGDGDILIPIIYENGIQEVRASPKSVYSALLIMQKNLEEATVEMETMDDEDALMILSEVDSRAGMRRAATKRLEALSANMTAAFTAEDENHQTAEAD